MTETWHFDVEQKMQLYDSSEISHKFRWLSFLACIGVILIHNRTYLTLPEASNLTLFIQRLGSEVLARFAVPCFFAVSGFWFARGGYIRNEEWGAFALKKVRSLLVPYLLWAIIGVVLMSPRCMANNILTHRSIMERTLFAIPGTWEKINALFGITGAGPFGDMPLWYLKSLMALFLISPLFLLLRRFPAVMSWILGLVLIFVGNYIPSVSILSLSANSAGWFIVGIALAESGFHARPLGACWTVLAGLMWITISVVLVAKMMGWICINTNLSVALAALCNLMGIVTFWGGCDYLISIKVPRVGTNLFWVYCFHQFVTSYCMAAISFIFGKSDSVALGVYIIGPFFYFLICYIVGKLLDRCFHTGFSVLNGGR